MESKVQNKAKLIKMLSVVLLFFVLCFSFSMALPLQASAEYGDDFGMPYEDRERSDDYERGYEDGVADGEVEIVYRTREVSAKEYIADHPTRFRELWITAFLTLGICVAPILLYKYGLKAKPMSKSGAIFATVLYNGCALLLITYILYRIDYLMPCASVVILWAAICKEILESGKKPPAPVDNPLYRYNLARRLEK